MQGARRREPASNLREILVRAPDGLGGGAAPRGVLRSRAPRHEVQGLLLQPGGEGLQPEPERRGVHSWRLRGTSAPWQLGRKHAALIAFEDGFPSSPSGLPGSVCAPVKSRCQACQAARQADQASRRSGTAGRPGTESQASSQDRLAGRLARRLAGELAGVSAGQLAARPAAGGGQASRWSGRQAYDSSRPRKGGPPVQQPGPQNQGPIKPSLWP